MRPVAVVAAALAGTLLATQAFASISVWSPDSAQGAYETHLTVFGAFARPHGDFGSTSSPGASFAMPGAGLGLELSIRTPPGIESGALALVDRNPTDSGALGASLSALLRQYGLPSEPLVVASQDWHVVWGLVKAGYAPKVGEHLQAFVDVYGGGSYGEYPEARLVAAPPNVSLGQERKSWFGPAAGMGAGLRWRDHLAIGLLYLYGSFQPSARAFTSPRQEISTLHATLGYSFGH